MRRPSDVFKAVLGLFLVIWATANVESISSWAQALTELVQASPSWVNLLLESRLRIQPDLRGRRFRRAGHGRSGAATCSPRSGDRGRDRSGLGGDSLVHDQRRLALRLPRDGTGRSGAEISGAEGGDGDRHPRGGRSPCHSPSPTFRLACHSCHCYRFGESGLWNPDPHHWLLRDRSLLCRSALGHRRVAAGIPRPQFGGRGPLQPRCSCAFSRARALPDVGSHSFRGQGQRRRDRRHQGART